jgi:2-haloacid dehalogenase
VHASVSLPRALATTTNALALPRADIGFVSSNRWDVMGAASFGFRALWVNRAGVPDEYADFAPLRRIGNLMELSHA